MFIHEKAYLLLVLFAFVTYTQQQLKDPAFLAKWQGYKTECAAEQGVDVAVAKKAWDENKFPEDPKLKCYYKCIATKAGMLDANGEVVDDKLGEVSAQFSDAALKKEIVEECGPLKGAELCETAFKLMVCIKAAILD